MRRIPQLVALSVPLGLLACGDEPCPPGSVLNVATDLCVLYVEAEDAPNDSGTPDTDEEAGGDSSDDGSGDGGSDGSDDASGSGDGGSGEGGDDSAGGDDSTGDDAGVEGDVYSGWPSTYFFPTYCMRCHPSATSATGIDNWLIYEHVVAEYDHIYCGVGLEMVPECGDHHDPGHLPQAGGPMPTDEERLRLIAWMDAGMPE